MNEKLNDSSNLIGSAGSYALSFPCVYPVCPISIDHARLYLIGDVLARHATSTGKTVLFPIGFHYSGLTAHKFSALLNVKEQNEIKQLFEQFYSCPPHVINYFKSSPFHILDYYTVKTIQDLMELKISADYGEYYTTNTQEYDDFVLAFFEKYKNKNALIERDGNLQLNYNDETWTRSMLDWAKEICILRPQEKVGLLNAARDLKNGWNILKKEGFGVNWSDGRIIDSMHDSELLSLYDIVNHVSKNFGTFNKEKFQKLFSFLGGDDSVKLDKPLQEVIDWLPTSMLVLEEHLKVWFIKKLYTENLLFQPHYRTKNFFVLGLGMKNGKRMSSSAGTAILLQDLLKRFGPFKTRMIILMAGGHPSSFYNYEEDLPSRVDKLYKTFKNFIDTVLVDSLSQGNLCIARFQKKPNKIELIQTMEACEKVREQFIKIDKYFGDGYYKQCLIEIMSSLPKKYFVSALQEKQALLDLINYYTCIFLGGNILELW